MKSIVQLQLSGNQFSGSISTSIGVLQNLVNLSLSRNILQGSIPESFADMVSLESLDLSLNNLSGPIPKSLEKLLHLGYLNFSSNELSGEIPNGGTFNKFPAGSFIGNEELCGAPQFHVKACEGNKRSGFSKTKIFLVYFLPSIVLIIIAVAFAIWLLRRRASNTHLLVQENSLLHPFNKRISYYEILQATNNVSEDNLIGRGSIGLVYMGIFYNGMVVAVKVFNLQLQAAFKSFEAECEALRNIRHRNFFKDLAIKEVIINSSGNDVCNTTILHYCLDACLAASVTNFTDEPALLAFKASIISDPNNILAKNWSEGISFCSWIGVSCSSEKRVTALNLPSMGLTGTIPKEVGNLTYLTSFNISNNTFNGTLPRELGLLQRLQSIHLRANKLSGSIPAEIGNLTKLEELDFGVNDFTEPIFNISSLQSIIFTNNSLMGHLPSSMGLGLPNLETLFLGRNELGGIIPSSISNSTRLSRIGLSENMFTGNIPPSFGELKFLRSLNLGYNKLTSESELPFVTSLANCGLLEILVLGPNPIKGTLPKSLGNLSTSLELLDATSCQIKGVIPAEIGNLSNLVDLSLVDNYLTGSVPVTIGKLAKIQSLKISNTTMERTIPDSICDLTNLVALDLSKNKLYGSIPSCLKNISSLQSLLLDNNELSSIIPTTLWSLGDILVLNLSSNALSGSLTQEIGNIKSVMQLDLSSNQFSGSIPSTTGQLHSLKELNFSNNILQADIPESFGGLISLEVLDLSQNSLSGNIPESLEKLVYLKYLNVSANKLSGEIPTEGPFANFTAEPFLHNDGLCGVARFHVSSCRHTLSTKHRFLYYGLPVISSTILVAAFIIVLLRHRNKNRKLPIQVDSSPGVAYRRISYHEILQATNNLSEDNLIGRGSVGLVYKGILSDGMVLAIKVFNLEQQGASKSFDAECEVMRNIRHRNLVKLWNSIDGNVHKKEAHGGTIYGGDEHDAMNILIILSSYLQGLQAHLDYLGAKSRNLKVVGLGPNQLNGLLPKFWGNLSSSLEILDVPGCHLKLKGMIPGEIRNLSNFLTLNLGDDDLTGSIPNSLGRLRKMQLLEIKGNISSLRGITLDSNALSSSIPSSVWNLKGILILNLSSNCLSGPLSPDIGNMKVITRLDLSGNQFWRSIPNSTGELLNLIELNILRNRLQGPLPESLANLVSLEVLVLSQNSLSGMIPKSLDALLYLKYLNVSFNSLSSEIPTGGHFANFTAESFMQNDALCGAPRFRVGACKDHQHRWSRKPKILTYGILLMEVFTRKKPTHEQFTEGMTLTHWVSKSFPGGVLDIVDINLLKKGKEDLSLNEQCFSSIMKLALECTRQTFEERIDMENVVSRLHKIKAKIHEDVRYAETKALLL
ncbi:hypothetical protein RJ640_001621 [Escallonia rubra]|uniref:non-specific serine/threonine protein kinase n=1 Tax=Escallonia rubra TaxID=112253 RepID=A0AA88RB79_9ASTE|nr:hypothetical protein RJ640_001621 [Escallonia rubra]